MANSSLAKIQVEQGQSLVSFAALTDSGDHIYFTPAAAVMSGKENFEPNVRPNGMVTGLNVVGVAASTTADMVDVAAFTAYSEGVLQSVGASADEEITRPGGDFAKINSITMTDAGAIAVVPGADAADQVFIETRGGNGGPPLIPVDSVEIAQVRVILQAATAITAAQIVQVVGEHTERSNFPSFKTNNIGLGSNETTAAAVNAHVKFADANPLIHTGPIARKVYVQHYTPIFTDISKSLEFVPVEETHSVASEQGYGFTAGSTSSGLSQGGFTALLDDGVSGVLESLANEILTFKFFPNRNLAPYILTQGKLGSARTYPVATDNRMAATISSDTPSANFTS